MNGKLRHLIRRDVLGRPLLDLLAMPAALLIPITSLAVPLLLAPYLIVLGFFVLVDIGRRKTPVPSPTPMLVALAVLIAWSALSILWSIAPTDSVDKLIKLIVLGVAAAVVVHGIGYLSSARRITVQRLFVFGWVLAAALFVLDIALDARLYKAIFYQSGDQDLGFVYLKRGMTVLMLTGWLIAAGLYARRARLAAVVCLVAIMLMAVAIAAKSVVVAWLIGVLTMTAVIALPRVGRRVLPTAVAILVAAAPFLAAGLPSDLTSIASDLPSSALHRLAIWRFSAERVAERPLLGWGLDSAPAVPGGDEVTPLVDWLRPHLAENPELSGLIQQFEAVPPQNLPLHPHNAALQWWLELGAVGAVLGAVIAMLAGRWLMAHTQNRIQAGFAAGLYAASITCAMLMFGVWQGWWLAALAFIAAGARLAWPATPLPAPSPIRATAGE